MSSSHRAFSSKFTCYKLSCLERIVFSSEGGPVAAVQMVIHVRVLMLTVQWMSTILKFSFESLQHYVFLSGKSDFHNDVLKMEIVKKSVTQNLNNYELFSLLPFLKSVAVSCSL